MTDSEIAKIVDEVFHHHYSQEKKYNMLVDNNWSKWPSLYILALLSAKEGPSQKRWQKTAQTASVMSKLKSTWIDKNISLKTKIKLLRSLVLSILLYTCVSWTHRKLIYRGGSRQWKWDVSEDSSKFSTKTTSQTSRSETELNNTLTGTITFSLRLVKNWNYIST